jgi:hypothetical protein
MRGLSVDSIVAPRADMNLRLCLWGQAGVLSALWTLPFVTLGIPYLSDRPAFITLVLASQCEKQRGNVHAENARQQYACGGFRSFAVPWNYWPMKGVRSNSADTRVHLFRDRHDR